MSTEIEDQDTLNQAISLTNITEAELHKFNKGHFSIEIMTAKDKDNKECQATRVILNPEEESTLTVTIDLDDTCNRYQEAKQEFHKKALEKIKTIPVTFQHEDEFWLRLLSDINGGARLLASDGSHPEAYSPKLELLTITWLISALRKKELIIDSEYLENYNKLKKLKGQTNSEAEIKKIKEEMNEWMRNNLVKKAFKYIPEKGIPSEQKEGGKTYFRKSNVKPFILETPATIERIFDNLTSLSAEEEAIFQSLFADYSATLFSPQINKNVIPRDDFKGCFVLATFGEDRFQVTIKVRNFLEKLKRQGLRLPDEIIIFEKGRKGPILKKYFEDHQKRNPQYKQIHLDNSQNQCESIEKLNIPGMKAILYHPEDHPEEDTHESFIDLISSVSGQKD